MSQKEPRPDRLGAKALFLREAAGKLMSDRRKERQHGLARAAVIIHFADDLIKEVDLDFSDAISDQLEAACRMEGMVAAMGIRIPRSDLVCRRVQNATLIRWHRLVWGDNARSVHTVFRKGRYARIRSSRIDANAITEIVADRTDVTITVTFELPI